MTDRRADPLAPHAVEAEEAVLGAILVDPRVLPDVSFLEPGDFFIVRHAWIYEALRAVHNQGAPIDPLIVAQELEDHGRIAETGGVAYLLSLVTRTPSALNAQGYGHIVKRMAWRRAVIEAASQMARLAHSDQTSIPDIHHQIVSMINRLGGGVLRGPRTLRDLSEQFYADAVEAVRTGQVRAGWATGFSMLDALMASAYGPGFMTVVGGYTNQGKTQIAAQLALTAASQGPALYVTLESGPEQIFNRLVAVQSGVPLTRVMQRDLGRGDELSLTLQAADALGALPLEIETLESLADIEGYLQDMSIRHDFQPGLVFIDDVDSLAQAVRGSSPYERLMGAADGLLRLTRRTGWGVVALKQLLMPKEARGVTSSARLLEILKPGIMSFEGGGAISQKGGNVLTMLSAEWIRAKVHPEFRHQDLVPGFVYFWKHKARDARSDSVVEVPLKFNAEVPRYEDVPIQGGVWAPKKSALRTPEQARGDRKVYGQATHDLEDDVLR